MEKIINKLFSDYLSEQNITSEVNYSFLAKNGWQQSEIIPSMGYRYLYDDVHAASIGLTAHLGLKDTEAPEIILW